MIINNGLYSVYDTYFNRFRSQYFCDNKQENRPYYVSFIDKEGIIWLVPLSSQVETYKLKIEKDVALYGNCLFYHIGRIAGIDRAILIGNMFPITETYIKKHYTISNTHYIIQDTALLKVINKKASIKHTVVSAFVRENRVTLGEIKTEEKSNEIIAVPELLEMLGFRKKADWVDLNAIGAVKSTVEEKGEFRTETRFFITSLTKVEEFAQAVREHWGIENQLHWYLDMIFYEDASHTKRDNSPLNLNVMRKFALPLLSAADFGRIGIRKKMFRAAMFIPSLEYILTREK